METESETKNSPQAPTASILIVDDETDILNLFRELLSRQGYSVFTAESGEEALEILNRHSVDLLLADLKMPGLNGFRLIQQVRRNFPSVQVVVMTGFGQQVLPLVQELGVEHFLVKPVEFSALLNMIRQLVRR